MKNRKQTSKRLAELAVRTLRDPRASRPSKSLAASALAQTAPDKPGRKPRRVTAKAVS